MAVQRKKKAKKNPAKSGKFIWTTKRKLAAKLLSESTDNYEDIAKRGKTREHVLTMLNNITKLTSRLNT